MNKRIGILGCGWLGLPLAERLVQLGYQVSGTTTSQEKISILQEKSILPYRIMLSEDGIKGDIYGFLSQTDILILNIPPALRRNPEADYLKKMGALNKEVGKHLKKNIVFVSSTSVYGDIEGEITEATEPKPTTRSGQQLLASEQLFSKQKNLKTTIIRFGGLIGGERHPVKHLAGKSNLTNGQELVNLIHLNDCIHMIESIIVNHYWGELFNGVYPYHPTKKKYYTEEAKKRKLSPPKYIPSDVKNRKKIIICKNFLSKELQLYTSIVS